MAITKASGSIVGDGSNTAILTPTSGQRFVLTHYLFTVNGSGLVTIYDETNNSANRIVYAYMSPGVAGQFDAGHALDGMTSAAVDNVLYANVPTGTTLYWQIQYFEST